MCVFGAYSIYSVTLIGVFLGHFLSVCTKLARSILMRDRNTGTQPNFQKRFLNVEFVEFCRRKTVVLSFLRCVNNKFSAVSKINN